MTADASAKMKILVVDDSQMNRDTLKDNLATLGPFHIDTAADGEIAVHKVEIAIKAEAVYDLIFLDWNMPVMDGFAALKLIRAMKPMNKCYITMLSAESESENIKMALAAGANIFMNKPFNLDKLKIFMQKFSKLKKS